MVISSSKKIGFKKLAFSSRSIEPLPGKSTPNIFDIKPRTKAPWTTRLPNLVFLAKDFDKCIGFVSPLTSAKNLTVSLLINLVTLKQSPIFISSFSRYYVHSRNKSRPKSGWFRY